MMDPRHAELLSDCEDYLERQQRLLDRLAAVGAAADILVGMDSALDQLSQAVAMQWRSLAPDLAPAARPAPDPEDPAAAAGT
jgi:ADP-heptose:LPS heptosyltransferase